MSDTSSGPTTAAPAPSGNTIFAMIQSIATIIGTELKNGALAIKKAPVWYNFLAFLFIIVSLTAVGLYERELNTKENKDGTSRAKEALNIFILLFGIIYILLFIVAFFY